MESFCIDYRDTGAFPTAVISYLGNDDRLDPFFAHPPTLQGLGDRMKTRQQPADRHVLAAVLEEQYARLAENATVDAAVAANIRALTRTETYTITTGHQLNIFTGPLFFIYKIVSAINLAKTLSAAYPEKQFVPVYWMATEDHDFDEINHLSIDGRTLSWEKPGEGATGRLPVDSIRTVLDEYCRLLEGSAFSAEYTAMITKAYTEQPHLASATRALVNALFGKYGVVAIDADDARLKKLFAPYVLDDLFHKHSFTKISGTSSALENAGFRPQVHAREVNFFYLADGLRERIEQRDGDYLVLNTTIRFTADELAHEVGEHPERFSPNVMLRPLYQEVILPNLAYIGGGAEMVYWLQLKAIFDHYRVDFPVLVLRNSALVMSTSDRQTVESYGFTLTELFLPEDELAKRWTLRHTENDLTLAAERAGIDTIFGKLGERVSRIDPTLGPSAAAVAARLSHALDNLEKKLLKAEKRHQAVHLGKLMKIRSRLFPGGSLQERKDNLGPWYAAYGPAFIEQLVASFSPLDFKFTILSA